MTLSSDLKKVLVKVFVCVLVYVSLYMYFTKIVSRNFIIVEGYEDEVLSRGFNFFDSCFSKRMLSILFTWRKVNFHAVFDRKNNNNATYLWSRAYTYFKRNFNSDVIYWRFTNWIKMFDICLSHKLIPQTSVDKPRAYLVS